MNNNIINTIHLHPATLIGLGGVSMMTVSLVNIMTSVPFVMSNINESD